MDEEQKGDGTDQANKDKNLLYIIIGALVVGSIALRLIDKMHLEQTTILFIGLPALLAAVIIKYTERPETAQGAVFRTITLFLLMSAILFGEGLVCIIFASPIFYGVGALLTLISEYFRKRNRNKLNIIVIIPLVLLLAEPLSYTKAPEMQSVTTEEIIDKKMALTALNKSPDFNSDLPGLFKIGFPRPIDIEGQGLEVGSTRTIQFESNTKGIGSLILQVTAIEKNEIIFEAIKDDTHINHWLTWKKVRATLTPLTNNKTKISWTSEYTCDLGPSWYFEPLEKIAVQQMHKHLIQSYFK